MAAVPTPDPQHRPPQPQPRLKVFSVLNTRRMNPLTREFLSVDPELIDETPKRKGNLFYRLFIKAHTKTFVSFKEEGVDDDLMGPSGTEKDIILPDGKLDK